MSEKEKLQGINLQVSAIFVRLDALRESLPEESRKEYLKLIHAMKEHTKEKFDVNEKQLEEWFQ